MYDNFSHTILSLNRIIDEIKKGRLSVFAGAGLSCGSGFVDWKTLMKPVFEQLEISDDVDLTVAAQYFDDNYDRQFLNTLIIDEFNKQTKNNENLDVLCDLPIESYWTTNYDSLIEDCLQSKGKNVDIITDQLQLKYQSSSRDAVVYKMHGDKSCPDKVILTKRDYETYDEERAFFSHSLIHDLIVKTFLFIGFSFKDPNFERIITYIKNIFGKHAPQNHYCFMRRVCKQDFVDVDGKINEDKYNKEKRLLEFRISDLQNYGIQTILVDDFNQITDILKYIRARLEMDNIFISGSAGANDTDEKVLNEEDEQFIYSLSKTLIERNYNIYTGYGREVGNNIVLGIFSAEKGNSINNIDKQTHIYPLMSVKDDKEKTLHKIRTNLIKKCGFFISLYGKELEDQNKIENDGMYKEYSIALEEDKTIIPIGASNGMARYIYNKIISEVESKYNSNTELKEAYKNLGGEKIDTTMIEDVISIINLMKSQKEKELEVTLKRSISTQNMDKKIFISYHYQNEYKTVKDIIAELKKISAYEIVNIEDEKLKNKNEITAWIDNKLSNADLTILIIGEETASREYVRYEIEKSIRDKKALLGIALKNNIKNPLDDIKIKNSKASDIFKTYSYNSQINWEFAIQEAFEISNTIY